MTDCRVIGLAFMTEFAKAFMGMEWGTLHTCLREAHADGRDVLCQMQAEENGSR